MYDSTKSATVYLQKVPVKGIRKVQLIQTGDKISTADYENIGTLPANPGIHYPATLRIRDLLYAKGIYDLQRNILMPNEIVAPTEITIATTTTMEVGAYGEVPFTMTPTLADDWKNIKLSLSNGNAEAHVGDDYKLYVLGKEAGTCVITLTYPATGTPEITKTVTATVTGGAG